MRNVSQIIDAIIASLQKIGPLSPGLEKKIRDLLVIEKVRRKYTFLKERQVSNRVYFITKGMVRGYYFDETGTERTAWIMIELDAMISVDSFFSQEPGEEYIETLEPTIVGSISYDELQELYKEFPEFNWHGRILTQEYYVRADKRAKELRSNDATKRYQLFVQNYPEIANRAKARYIASYIGVEDETLYKIKNGNYNYPRKK
jgi:CRP-like cAMP-binding protein